MNFTWTNTLAIIKDLFECLQDDIAKHLNVTPSALSHRKKATTDNRIKNDEIPRYYEALFDPSSKTSFAYGKDEKDLLMNLEYIIEHKNLKNIMEDCWIFENDYTNGNYKDFVINMLKRTTNQIPKKPKDTNAAPPLTTPTAIVSESEQQTIPHTAHEAEEINQEQIKKQIASDPAKDAELAYPDQYRKCLCCINWKGNTIQARLTPVGTYGSCLLHNTKRLSSSASCKDFQPDYGKMPPLQLNSPPFPDRITAIIRDKLSD